MATLSGQTIDPERLRDYAEAMYEALHRIAEHSIQDEANANERDILRIARSALAPCHFFDFSVPTGEIACTDPEDMKSEQFECWLRAIPEDKRESWKVRRLLRHAARDYVASLHNADKRTYAAAYLAYLIRLRAHPGADSTLAPPKSPRLTIMGAQAVRLKLCEILDKTPADNGVPAAPTCAPASTLRQDFLMPIDPFTQPALI